MEQEATWRLCLVPLVGPHGPQIWADVSVITSVVGIFWQGLGKGVGKKKKLRAFNRFLPGQGSTEVLRRQTPWREKKASK